MTLQEFRLQNLTNIAKEYNVDLMVSSHPANSDYISGYRSIGMDVLASTQAYAVYCPATGSISTVASIAELPSICEVLGEDADLYCYGAFRFGSVPGFSLGAVVEKVRASRNFASPEEALATAIKDAGAKRVALDEARCTVPSWNKIAELCPGVELIPASDIFMKARFFKHEDEIAGLQKSVEIAEKALAFALKDFKAGMTELDLEYAYKSEVCRLGAETFFFVATAAHRAAYADTPNTDLVIKEGDMIRFDFGCIYKGYCSDIARTASVGTPTEKVATCYEAVRRGTTDAIAAIKPGMTAEEIFDLAVKFTRENGIPHYERHHCGHGIGVECYDFPSVRPGDKTPMQENMTLCIETPYYELGWGGVQLEDTIVITKDGARYLDSGNDELIILPV